MALSPVIIKRIKKIALWFSIGVLSVIILTFVLSYLYRERITNFIVQELGSQINGDFSIRDIDISFYSNFPNVSIQLHDVIAKSTPGFNVSEFSVATNNAIEAKKISFSFNILDFLHDKYIVQEIIIYKANINVFQDQLGNHNWNFTTKNADTLKQSYFLELSAITIVKSTVNAVLIPSKIKSKQYFDDLDFSGRFFDENFTMAVESKFVNEYFEKDGLNMLQGLEVELETSITRNKNNYKIHPTVIEVPYGILNLQGDVQWFDAFVKTDISYDFTIPDIETLKPILTTSAVNAINEYKLNAYCVVDGNIKGVFSDTKSPALVANVKLRKGDATYEKQRFSFELTGKLYSNQITKLNEYGASGVNLHLQKDNTKISSVWRIHNLKTMQVSIDATIDGKFEDLSYFIQPEGYELTGDIKAKATLHGILYDFDPSSIVFYKEHLQSFESRVANTALKASAASPYQFTEVVGNVSYANQQIVLDSVSGKIQGQDFEIQGQGDNLLQYFIFDNQVASFNGKAFISKLHINPFKDYYYKNKTAASGNSVLNLAVNFTSKQVIFDNYKASDVACNLSYVNNALDVTNAKMQFLGGAYKGALSMKFNADGTSICEGEGDIKKIAIKDIFNLFNNFDQDFLKSSQIDGLLTSKFSYAFTLDKQNNPNYKTMKILSKMLLENGSIQNFEPFIDMGKKMKVEEFKNVTFKKIENQFRIEKDTIYIPVTEIKTNAFEMLFTGKHTVSNSNFTYFVTLFMNQTLSKMFVSKNPKEDFGEIEKNADGNTRVPVKIYGNPDKYSIDYDFKTRVENIKQGWKRQGDEWRAILGKETEPQNQSNTNGGSAEPTNKTPKPQDKPIKTDFEIEY